MGHSEPLAPKSRFTKGIVRPENGISCSGKRNAFHKREKHREAREWAYRHFPDREHGEWFGYLHRDGSLSTRVEGTLFKGAFHLPRMQLVCMQILDRIAARPSHSQA